MGKHQIQLKPTAWDRFTSKIAPRWTFNRMLARAKLEWMQRNYEAASKGRRTSGWAKKLSDANTAISTGLVDLRAHARDLVRNNAWARRGLNVIANNTVGWGIVPKAAGLSPDLNQKATDLWKQWANSTACDVQGRLTFYGMQRQAMMTVPEAGEILVRRVLKESSFGPIPMQLQLLEPDYLDQAKEGATASGSIIQGVEFDSKGTVIAFWLFDQHPGTGSPGPSKRVEAENIIQMFRTERPGQVRGASWFAPVILTLKDLDSFEDAQLKKQEVSSMMAGFITDLDGAGTAIGEQDSDDAQLEGWEPGMLSYLPPGKSITFSDPPSVTEESFSIRNQRKVSAGLGIPYEEMTSDYSQVNFSSARMSRLSHWANVHDWRYNMLIPQLCNGVWAWAMEATREPALVGLRAEWSAPPPPMIEPDKEGLAYQRLVRNGVMTPSEVVREQGGDPETHWQEYSEDLKRLDELGIQLDCDVRKVSQAGLTQQRAGGQGDQAPQETPADRALKIAIENWVEDLSEKAK